MESVINKIIVGHTSLGLFQHCEAAYYWKYVRKLVLKGVRAAPLEFGIAIHAALEERDKGASLVEAIAKFDELYPVALDNKRIPKSGHAMLKEYYDRRQDDHLETIHTEKMHKVELENCFYSMRLDRIVNDRGVVKILDYKTASDIGVGLMEQMFPNGQFTSYIFGAQDLMGDDSIDTLIVDGLLTPKVYKTKEIVSDTVRVETTRTPFEIELWKENVSNQVDRILELRANGGWIKSEDEFGSCRQFTGNCEYKELCSIPARLEDVQPMGDMYEERRRY